MTAAGISAYQLQWPAAALEALGTVAVALLLVGLLSVTIAAAIGRLDDADRRDRDGGLR